jgi:hypothetical protein
MEDKSRDRLIDWLRGLFDEAMPLYAEQRYESLPEDEQNLIQAQLQAVEVASQPEKRAISMFWMFSMCAVVRNGFRPSEFIFSWADAISRQLNKIRLSPEDIGLSGSFGSIELNKIRTWLIYW